MPGLRPTRSVKKWPLIWKLIEQDFLAISKAGAKQRPAGFASNACTGLLISALACERLIRENLSF
jgi:hypothetical protein